MSNAMFILFPDALEQIYPPSTQARIAELVHLAHPPQTKDSVAEDPSLLADLEILISGWGAPVLDEDFLNAAPNLQAVFYGAGSIRSTVTSAFWGRDIPITTAVAANSRPVAEFVVGAILLSLKHFWSLSDFVRRGGAWLDPVRNEVPGGYESQVGFISVGNITRRTLALLEPYDLHRFAYCPWLSAEEAAELDVTRLSIEDVFRQCDVVSIHTPRLPETRGQITGEHIASMKPGATIINTARGAVIREQEMIEVLAARPDVTAVLDVTDPEPPVPGSPLWDLPNVVLTPHIAGSIGSECRRMGQYMEDEIRRFVQGEPMKYRVTREVALSMA